jgi:phytoene synthase
MQSLYQDTCRECAALITRRYSTSFSMGIRAFSKGLRGPIYSIYGFVRFADEIVDTFHDHDRAALLARFREDTWTAIRDGISLNPVLQAFQEVVHRYKIDHELIEAFLDSMAMDLEQDSHERASYDTYIYGSAEVVGLMCLRVFVDGDESEYQRLKDPARRLGAAFQKINFLRDMQSDFEDRGRIYFPGVDFRQFTEEDKRKIEQEVDADFKAALAGIMELPSSSRFGVYLAYRFYYKLFKKICGCTPEHVLQNRVRVSNMRKFFLIFDTWLQSRLRLFTQ